MRRFMVAVGLAQVLAQLGLLIPAQNIEISPVDHIFVHFPKYPPGVAWDGLRTSVCV